LIDRDGEKPTALELAQFVAGMAGLALDVAERRLQGSRYKVPRRVASSLMANSRFKTDLEKLSERQGKSLTELRQEAARIIKEMIAVPSPFWIDVNAALNRHVIRLGYETDVVVDRTQLEKVRQLTRENPTAIVFTHKTHVDSAANASLLYENDFPMAHTLGGVNMAFAGLGFMARRAGAIFIRRSFRDDVLYKTILRQYLGYLLEKRFPLSWAFEGTRSRVGKLMPPRYGLIKYVVEAAHNSDARNLHFIPVAINYDLIGDVNDYVAFESGESKRPESLVWFIGYLRGLRQPMGRVYFNIGKPVVLDRAPSGDDILALQKIAFQIGVEVNKVSPITLPSLVTMILLGASPRALTREELTLQMRKLIDWVQQRDIPITSDFEPSNLDHMAALSQVLVDNGMLTRYDGGPEVVYAISQEQHRIANYYRNTTIHHFVNKAIIELSLLYVSRIPAGALDRFWHEAERLRDMFKFEFFYAPVDEFREQISAELKRSHPNWESSIDKSGALARDMITTVRPLVAHSTLLAIVEAYRVVADVVARRPHDIALSEKKCVNEALAYGRQALLQRRISSDASIGKLLFANGHKLAKNMGLTEAGDVSLEQRRRAFSQDLRELAHRIDIIRTIALSR
jgi:glycerol-3-phosphate O-acyltransferase